MSMQEIYEHFHPDERSFVDRAWEWVVNSGDYHEMKLTDFLDPRQGFILESLVNRHPDAALHLSGGYEGAERKRAYVGPDYRDLTSESLELVVLAITSSDTRVDELDHGDYLGAILGLGLKRDKIGDIHVHPDGAHVIIAEEIAPFIDMHLNEVGRLTVSTDIIGLESLRTSTSRLEPLDLTVASLRLDGIVSDVFRLSRSKVLIPIRAGRCRVNWKSEDDPSKPLKSGDVVSLQGFGRFKVLELEGVTKKGRYRVKIGKYL